MSIGCRFGTDGQISRHDIRFSDTNVPTGTLQTKVGPYNYLCPPNPCCLQICASEIGSELNKISRALDVWWVASSFRAFNAVCFCPHMVLHTNTFLNSLPLWNECSCKRFCKIPTRPIEDFWRRHCQRNTQFCVRNLGLDLTYMVGQGFDSSMSGKYAGTQSRLFANSFQMPFMSTVQHALNLVISKSCQV
jgi:hypothetical protein